MNNIYLSENDIVVIRADDIYEEFILNDCKFKSNLIAKWDTLVACFRCGYFELQNIIFEKNHKPDG